MKRRSFLRLFSIATVAATSSACFGSFQAIRWVYGVNKGISGSKFIQWLVFLVFTVLPVYGIAALIDVWVLNSIEFWFGGSSISENGEPERERVVQLGNGETLHLQKDVEAGLLQLHYQGRGKNIEMAFLFDEDGARVVDASGGEVARARPSRTHGVEVLAGREVIASFQQTEVEDLLQTYEGQGARGTAAWASARYKTSDRDVARR